MPPISQISLAEAAHRNGDRCRNNIEVLDKRGHEDHPEAANTTITAGQ
jgi:hypothetical protein